MAEFLVFLITTRKKSILTSVLKRNPYTTGSIQKSYTVSAAKRCMMESLKLSPKWKWKPWVLWAWAERSLYFLSRWLLPFTTNVNVLSKRRFCGGRGGRRGGGVLAVITHTAVRHHLLQRHWSIKLWGNYTRSTEVRESERQEWACRIGLSDGQKTQEQLRKPAALLSEVKRVQRREGEQRSRIGVLFRRSLYQGSFKNFKPSKEKSGGCEWIRII